MTVSDNLFQLIKGMSHGERWHFKTYANRHFPASQKNYIKLFEAILKQDTYDEAALKRKLKKEKFVAHLSVVKTYLYKLILESLESYTADHSPARRLKTMVNRIEILYDKGLAEQANKLLRKAQKYAGERELSVAAIELMDWEYRLLDTTGPIATARKNISKLHQKEERLLAECESTRAFDRLARDMDAYFAQYGFPRSPAEVKKCDFIFKHPLLEKEANALTKKALRHYYDIKAFYHVIRADEASAYAIYRKSIALMEQYPNKLFSSDNERLDKYAGEIYKFLIIATTLKRFDAYFEEKIVRMRDYEKELPHPERLILGLKEKNRVNYLTIRFRQYIASAKFEEGEALIKAMQTDDFDYENVSDPYLLNRLFLMMGMFTFTAARYGDSLVWFNRWLGHQQAHSREAIYSYVKMLSTIAHFEEGNEQLLEYNIKSTYRFFSRIARLRRTEKLIFRFFRNDIPRIRDNTTLTAALSSLYNDLLNLQHLKEERQVFGQPQLMWWLQSRIEGKPLPDIVRLKQAES